MLIDFGSARGEIASHSKTVSALVKPGYSPYEQYATTSSQQGPWTDIYALGATLYHALVGQAPAGCALAHGQRRVRAGPRCGAQLLPSERSWRPSTRRCELEVGERPQSIAAMARHAAGAGAQARGAA